MFTLESKDAFTTTPVDRKTSSQQLNLSGLKAGNVGLEIKNDDVQNPETKKTDVKLEVLKEEIDTDVDVDVVCKSKRENCDETDSSDKTKVKKTSRRKRRKNRAKNTVDIMEKKSRRKTSGCAEKLRQVNPPLIQPHSNRVAAPSFSELTCVRPLLFDRSKKPVITGVKSESYIAVLSPQHVTPTRENGGLPPRRLSGGRHADDVRKPNDTDDTVRRSEEIFRRLLSMLVRRENSRSPVAQELLSELSARIRRLRLYIDGREAQIPPLPTFTISVESDSPRRPVRNVEFVPRPCHSVEVRDCGNPIAKHRCPSDELLLNRKFMPVAMSAGGGAVKQNIISIPKNCNSNVRSTPMGDTVSNGVYNQRIIPNPHRQNGTTTRNCPPQSTQHFIPVYPVVCQQCLLMLPTCPHGNCYVPNGFFCPHYQYLCNHYHHVYWPPTPLQNNAPQPAITCEPVVITCLPPPPSPSSPTVSSSTRPVQTQSLGFATKLDYTSSSRVPVCPPSITRVPPCPPSITEVPPVTLCPPRVTECVSYEQPCAISVPLPRAVKPKESDEALKKCMAETTRVALVDRVCALPCGYHMPLQCATSSGQGMYTAVSSRQVHHVIERTPSGKIVVHDCECTDDTHVLPETSRGIDQRKISFIDHGEVGTQENNDDHNRPRFTSPPPEDGKEDATKKG